MLTISNFLSFMSLYQLLEKVQNQQLKPNVPVFNFGDTVRVGVLIQEGNKERVQTYQGTLIAQHRAHRNSTITIRRIFQGVGIERVFMVHSNSIQNIEILRCSKVRRAKLYYLRDRKGKATRLRERFVKVRKDLK